jgi:hypothetical protein
MAQKYQGGVSQAMTIIKTLNDINQDNNAGG